MYNIFSFTISTLKMQYLLLLDIALFRFSRLDLYTTYHLFYLKLFIIHISLVQTISKCL